MKETKASTLRGSAQLADLQGALCVPPSVTLQEGVIRISLGVNYWLTFGKWSNGLIPH